MPFYHGGRGVPKRQVKGILGDETIIYGLESGSGINKKPYATDEYQSLLKEYARMEQQQAEIDKKIGLDEA